MTGEDFLDEFFPVDGQLKTHAHVVVVERLLVDPHREGVVQRAGGLENVDDRNALDEVNRFGVNPVDEVHFTVHHSVLACGDVDEGQHGHRVKMPATLFPVVGVLFELGTNTRLKVLQFERPRSDTGCPIQFAIFRGQDRQVVVTHDVREVGVALLQFNDHVVAIGLNRLDRREKTFSGRLGVFTHMEGDGIDHVLGGQRLPVMELDALANGESPLLRVSRGVKARG